MRATPMILHPPRPLLPLRTFESIEQARDYLATIHGVGPADLSRIRLSERQRETGRVLYAYIERLEPQIERARGFRNIWPPMILEVPQGVLDTLSGGKYGVHIQDTNLVLLAADPPLIRGQRIEDIVVHELTHYVDYLLHGPNISMRTDGGQVHTVIPPRYLEEGYANYATLILLREMKALKGERTTCYPYETGLMILLAEVAGAEEVLNAGRSGHWEGVQDALNRKFGPGTFESILRCRSGEEAFNLLVSRNSETQAIDMRKLELDRFWIITRRTIDTLRGARAGPEI